jgi:hypothetical protein
MIFFTNFVHYLTDWTVWVFQFCPDHDVGMVLFFLVLRPESNLRLPHYRNISYYYLHNVSTFVTENLIYEYYRVDISYIILQKVTDKSPFLIQQFKSAFKLKRGVEYCLLDTVAIEISDLAEYCARLSRMQRVMNVWVSEKGYNTTYCLLTTGNLLLPWA